MKPEQRLADALDAVAPGVDDLVNELPDVHQEVKDALMDVMLGIEMSPGGLRNSTGLNTYIKLGIPVPIIRLISWQDALRRALEKL